LVLLGGPPDEPQIAVAITELDRVEDATDALRLALTAR
jgi:hypothetical protein